MPIEPDQRQQLAAVMEDRRLELRLTWQEVAEHGGISLRALSSARAGSGDIRPLTRRGIDRGLQWLEGCGVDNILAGRPPLPAELGPAPPHVESLARDLGIDPNSPAVAAIRQQINRAELAYGDNPAGAQVFGTDPAGAVESAIWDDPRAGSETKIIVIAGLRADRARHEAGRGDGTVKIGLAPPAASGGAWPALGVTRIRA